MRRVTAVALAIVFACVLTACSNAGTAAPVKAVKTAPPLPAPVFTTVPVPVPTNSEPIQQQLVDALKRICTTLSDYTSTASNWQLTPNNNGSAPYELALDGGDGGTLIVDVTPGTPYASVSVSPANYDTTNTLLAYSGCATITTMPPAPPPPVTQTLVPLPSFVGHTYNQWVDWQNNAHVVFTNVGRSFSQTTDCRPFSGDTLIVGQSIPPGTMEAQGNHPEGLRIFLACS